MYLLRVGNTVSKHRWGYKLQNFPEAVLPVPKPISYLPVYNMKRIALARSQGLTLLRFFPQALSFSQSLINADIFFISMITLWFSNVLWFEQHKYQNLIEKNSMDLYVAKIFFLQFRRWRFLAILVSDTKMSKLPLCFSILFL